MYNTEHRVYLRTKQFYIFSSRKHSSYRTLIMPVLSVLLKYQRVYIVYQVRTAMLYAQYYAISFYETTSTVVQSHSAKLFYGTSNIASMPLPPIHSLLFAHTLSFYCGTPNIYTFLLCHQILYTYTDYYTFNLDGFTKRSINPISLYGVRYVHFNIIYVNINV